MINNRFAIFPLPVYLLPGGITKLRIFEPKYIKMIKESGDAGFVLSLYKSDLENQTSPWGVHVNIVDFDLLPDGLLSIVVQANTLGSLNAVDTDENGLRHGNFLAQPHWHQSERQDELAELLSAQLRTLMAENKAFGELYESKLFDAKPQWQSPQWVARRWLEVLPISYRYREKFIHVNTFMSAQNYIQTMVLGIQNSTTIKSN